MKSWFKVFSLLLVGVLLFGCLGSSDQSKTMTKDEKIAKIAQMQVKDCKSDFNCFVAAAENCEDAKVNYSISLNLFGIMSTSNASYGLNKETTGLCTFSLITNSIDVGISPDALKTASEKGVTPEQQQQIDKLIQSAREHNAKFIGKPGSCTGDTSLVYAFLKRWEEGKFSTQDWSNLKCTGPYFEEMGFNSETGTSQFTSQSSKSECFSNSDCDTGSYCSNGACLSNDFLSSFAACTNNKCAQSCVNCKKGQYACMHSTNEVENNKCVECFMDLQCKTGYKCNQYKCEKTNTT